MNPSERSGGGRTDGPSHIYIYADESCLGNQFRTRSNPGGAAGLVEQFRPRGGWARKDFARFEPDTTNNRMALWSGILGLGALRRPSEVVFTSDSQYLVRGMKEWIHGWARRGWKRKGGEIENLELWQELAGVARRHRVEWRWIRGHAGHPKNEYANELAIGTARTGEGLDGLVPSGFDDWIQARIDAGQFVDYLDVPPDEPFEPDPAAPAPS
jgi:ribonuclease HI